MEVIYPDAEAGCGYSCIGACWSLCFVPPLYLISISDDVAWAAILSNPQQ